MNKLATVTFTTTDVPLPADTTPGIYQATLFLGTIPAGGPVEVTPGVEFTFPITLPGDYHVEVSRLDANGVLMASPAVSDPQTVQPDMVSVPLAVSFTLTDVVAPVPGAVTLAVV